MEQRAQHVPRPTGEREYGDAVLWNEEGGTWLHLCTTLFAVRKFGLK